MFRFVHAATLAAVIVAPLVSHAQEMEMLHSAPVSVTTSTLRVKLSTLLQEHALLAASATGAALGGRHAEFESAAAALDMNSVDISKAIGRVYGAGAEQAFLALWRKHIGFFVDYTVGVATRDKAKSDKAVADLVG